MRRDKHFVHHAGMHVSEIIAAFGGRRPLAKLLNTSPQNVSNMVRLGIPLKYHSAMILHASVSRIAGISFDTLANAERGSPAPRNTSRAAEAQAA